MDMRPRVRLTTDLGEFVVAVDIERAPITANNFLSYVDRGHLNGATVYRIVSNANQSKSVTARIEVIQFGLQPEDGRYPAPLPAIAHESDNANGAFASGRDDFHGSVRCWNGEFRILHMHRRSTRT